MSATSRPTPHPSEPSRLGQIAHDDAESSKTPTDRGEASDDTYRENLRSATPGRERDR